MLRQPFVRPRPFLQFPYPINDWYVSFDRGSAIARLLPTNKTTKIEYTQTSMSGEGLEPMTRVFEQAKICRALHYAAILVGTEYY
jgi:hypothetical protein